MTILVIAEHDNKALAPATLNTVAAAAKIGGDVHVLVVGNGCRSVAEGAAKLQGVAKVLLAEGAQNRVSPEDDVVVGTLAEP